MSQVNWLDVLGWDNKRVKDIRMTAYFYIRQGKYEIAEIFCKALVTLNPDNAYDLHTLGALYLEIGDPNEAINYLDKALTITPSDSMVKINRVKALFELKKINEAKVQASQLIHDQNQEIAGDAQALIMAYS
jgi:predicted Zn-dependent protease